ncbi:MAG: isocitrate lyase/PEP mutase family protein, partial [Granulosicoccaceae bacterium]
MTLQQRCEQFHSLHQPNNPLVLYNIWDAASAKTIEAAGAQALATGSWSVAGAQGYADGEALPLDFLIQLVERIVASVSLPLSVDFEGGYAVAPDAVAENVAKLIAVGVVGVNLEDQRIGEGSLYSLEEQTRRLAAIRAEADRSSEKWFI